MPAERAFVASRLALANGSGPLGDLALLLLCAFRGGKLCAPRRERILRRGQSGAGFLVAASSRFGRLDRTGEAVLRGLELGLDLCELGGPLFLILEFGVEPIALLG